MEQTFERPAAAAHMQGGSLAPQLTGTIRFFPVKRGVLVTANVQGLPADNPCGVFALHIHTGSSCAGAAFEETGAHYNPSGAAHPCHAGDLPPLFSCGGSAFLAVLTDRFQLQDVLGRTVVIHSGPDDFSTQPAGNAGAKIASGIIQAV